jgi:4-carboxymuconolactone decarboxylase
MEDHMSLLNNRERELVAIGAALASNCIPCIEYHIQEARKAGLSHTEIEEAISFADKIRRVPADKVLKAASSLLAAPIQETKEAPAACCANISKSS